MKHTIVTQIKIYQFLRDMLFMKNLVDLHNKNHRAYEVYGILTEVIFIFINSI
jgi:hypothetical protein